MPAPPHPAAPELSSLPAPAEEAKVGFETTSKQFRGEAGAAGGARAHPVPLDSSVSSCLEHQGLAKGQSVTLGGQKT